MHLIYYILYHFLSCLKNHIKFSEQEFPYQCIKKYFDCNDVDKKGFLQVFKEVNHLCKYWHCFPDTYFVFTHYLKEYKDIKMLETFVPQPAYWRFCKGGAESTSYSILINDKIIFHDLMTQYGIPIPKMLFVLKNNHYFVNNHIVSNDDINNILKQCKEDRIFVKLPCAGAAKGVFILKRQNEEFYLDNEIVKAEKLKIKFLNKNVLFEERLEQEPILKAFNPDTVNTIRVLTKNINGKAEIISAAARFGRKGQYVDNMHAGGFGVSINIETGKLETYGGRRFDRNHYFEHPDSHLKFEGVNVPYWTKIKEIVINTINVLPPYKSLGFDIVTSKSGPLILEINTGAGMDLAQIGKTKGIEEKLK